MGSAWQVIKTRQERIFQMCNRWNQGGNEQEQSVHQRSPPTERLCSTSQSHTDSRISGLQQELCLGLFGIIVVMLLQFFENKVILRDGHCCVLKEVKSGTCAFIIHQAFISSFMSFDSILFEVSKLDEVELLIAERIMPDHRYLDNGSYCV